MVFVTVICLIVAAYFLWEALKEKKRAEAGSSMSTAHRISTEKNEQIPAADYQNTRPASQPASSHATAPAAQTANQATASAAAASASVDESVARQNAAPVTNSTLATNSSALSDASANDTDFLGNASIAPSTTEDADTNLQVAAGAATVGAMAGAVAATSSGLDSPAGLRFLDGPIGRPDDLTQINGVGPVIEEGLNDLGIFHYHQIANFTENDIKNVDAELDFPGRIGRENWVEQARKLSSISLEKSTLVEDNDQLDSVVSIDEHAPNVTNPDSVLTDADYTGVWNTDVLIEIQERLKVLNTRISDAPRMHMTRDEYTAIKANEDAMFSRERLLEILDRLRQLDS